MRIPVRPCGAAALALALAVLARPAAANLAVIGFQQPLSHNWANSLVQSTDVVVDLRGFTGTTVPSSDSGVTGSIVYVLGTTAIGDGGAGAFYWQSASTAADDGVNVIKPSAVTGAGRWLREPAQVPTVATNAALTAIPALRYPAVLREGVLAAGDAPPQWFVGSATSCSIPGGDVGSEVPANGGGCFNAAPAARVSPREFGAKGDGVTDDTTALQNAINATAANATLALGAGHYCVTALALNAPITIEGVGNGGDNGTAPSELIACATNPAAMITLNAGAQGSVLTNFGVAPGTSTASATSGSAIIDQAEQTTISHLTIPYACNAFLDLGNSTKFLYNRLTGNAFQPNCAAVQLGNASVSSTDPYVVGNTIDEAKPAGVTANTNTVGMLLVNAGGFYIAQNDILYEDYGTRILPSGTEVVDGGVFADTVVGDTTSYDCLDVAALSSTATASQLSFNHVWAGSCGNQTRYNVSCSGSACWGAADGVWVVNSGGGAMRGIHFVGLRSNDAGGNSIYTNGAIADLTFDGGAACGGNQANSAPQAVKIDSTASDVALRGMTVGGVCDGAGVGGPGVLEDVDIISGAGPVTLTGNSFIDTTPILGTPANIGTIIANNRGLDTGNPSIASAATIAAPFNPQFNLTGAVTVTTINNGWVGRVLRINDGGGAALAGGGNIASYPASFAANQLITCLYGGSSWSCR